MAWHGRRKEQQAVKRIDATIEGTTPLIINKFTDAAQLAATSGSSQANRQPSDPREAAMARLYVNDKGVPVLPQPNLFRCFIEGGRFFKSGKSKVTTQRNSLVAACLSVDGLHFPIQSTGGWSVDTRPIRNPATGGRMLRYRPIFHDWRISFSMSLMEEIIARKLLREIVDASGKLIGLGDFRPDCKGPFGKFVVVEWREE